MDKNREQYTTEIARMVDAIRRTKSEHLRMDYRKAVSRMRRELKAYDRYKRESGAGV